MRLLRTAIGVPLVVLATMLGALVIMVSGERPLSDTVVRLWSRFVLFLVGARARRVGGESIDPKRSYVFIANHTSLVDVPAIVALTPTPLRFVAKRELSHLPLFGYAARRMGHVFVDRGDRESATTAIRDRIARGFDRGVALFFFPEGTRSTTEDLLPFKKGAAMAALETGLDFVPVAVVGARRVLPPKGVSLFTPGPVTVVFGDPVPIAGHTLEDRDALVAAQRAAVEATLARARAAHGR